jgi:hypothetical protein
MSDSSQASGRLRRLGRRQGPWLLASSIALGVMVAPFAIAGGDGKPVRLGKRNPGTGAITKETQIIAKSGLNTYGTRQSNLGAGGGAVYGCRSALGADPGNPNKSTACMRASNLKNGEAFQFQSIAGPIIGVVQSGINLAVPNPNAKPFITNATGEATGLNADRVDGLNAADIVAAAQAQNPAGAAPSFAFARVTATGTTDQSRSQGVTDTNISRTTTGVYCFTGLTSRPKNANVTLDAVPGETSVDTTTNAPGAPCNNLNNVQLIVRTYDSTGVSVDKPFYLTLTGTTGG